MTNQALTDVLFGDFVGLGAFSRRKRTHRATT